MGRRAFDNFISKLTANLTYNADKDLADVAIRKFREVANKKSTVVRWDLYSLKEYNIASRIDANAKVGNSPQAIAEVEESILLKIQEEAEKLATSFANRTFQNASVNKNGNSLEITSDSAKADLFDIANRFMSEVLASVDTKGLDFDLGHSKSTGASFIGRISGLATITEGYIGQTKRGRSQSAKEREKLLSFIRDTINATLSGLEHSRKLQITDKGEILVKVETSFQQRYLNQVVQKRLDVAAGIELANALANELPNQLRKAYDDPTLKISKVRGSPSLEDSMEDHINKAIEEVKARKPVKPLSKKTIAESKGKSQPKGKRNINVDTNVPRDKPDEARFRSADIDTIVNSLAAKAFISPTSVLSMLNAGMHDAVQDIMGPGGDKSRLNYISGRFAKSAKVLSVVQNRDEYIATYTYMKYPYATFAPGGKQYNTSFYRNPQNIIKGAMRNIAGEAISSRMRIVEG